MAYIARVPSDVGNLIRQRREMLGLSKKAVAERAGRVREVVYRLERGEASSVTSLFDVLRALGLAVQLVPAGLPTLEELAAAFNKDDEDDDAA